jgi:DNA-binding Lrp family transcriptional regulator
MAPFFSTLDLYDRKILAELEINSRQSNEAIGRKVRLSKQSVKSRIDQLQEKGIILGFWTAVNHAKLGFECASVFIKLKKHDLEAERFLIENLKKKINAVWIAELVGNYDLGISIIFRNIGHLDEAIKVLCKESGVEDPLVCYNLTFSIMPLRIMYQDINKEFITKTMSFKIEKSSRVKIDKLDEKILGVLARDARIPLIKIAKEVNSTANTVKYRMKQLVEKEVIFGYRPITNYNALNLVWYQCLIKTCCENEELIKYLNSHPNVTVVYSNIGQLVSIDIHSSSITEFNNIKNDLKKKFSEIIKGFNVLTISKVHRRVLLPENK